MKDSINDYNQKIYIYRRSGDYQTGVEFFKQKVHGCFSTDVLKGHPYLIPNLLYCLRKIGQTDAAFTFIIKHLKVDVSSSIPETWKCEIGWLLYYKLSVSNDFSNTSSLLAKWVGSYLEEPVIIDNFLLWKKLISAATTRFSQSKDWAIYWSGFLSGINPDKLSCKPLELITNDKKCPVKASSPRELLYVNRTKVLFTAEDHPNCIASIEEALSVIPRFHHGNQLWLSRRLALCLGRLGETANAIEKMKSVLSEKDEWFIKSEIGELFLNSGDRAQAFSWFASAALTQGHSEYKVRLYELMWETCQNSALLRSKADDHFMLATSVRKEKSWRIPSSLREVISKYNFIAIDEIENSKILYQRLTGFWKEAAAKIDSNKSPSHDTAVGKVTRILNDGHNGDGFITTHDGLSIYFRMKSVKRISIIELGDSVVCAYLEREYKGKKVLNAKWVEKK